MNALWIALGFLTRFPSKSADFNPIDAARSVFWFPVIGALVGTLVWLSAHVAVPVVGVEVAAFVALAAWVWVTGALHLDGMADTCDGFSASSGGTARALEAMKDSRIGAHGACGLVLVLLGKWVLLRRSIELDALAISVITSATIARLGVGFLLAWANPATASGLGALFARELRNQRGRWVPWTGMLCSLLLLAGIGSLSRPSWQVVLICFATALFIAAFVLFVFARRCQACFGGVTGDTHGAAIEVVEVLALAVHAAVLGMVSR